MSRSRRDTCGRQTLLCAVAILTGLTGAPAALGQDALQPPAAPVETVYLLSVSVNTWPLGLVARFRETPDGRLSLPADQFEGLGLRLDESFVTVENGERRVYLDQAPDLSWRFDRRSQTIDISAPFERLTPQLLRVAPRAPRIESRADWGALIGYDVYGEWSEDANDPTFGRSGSVNLDARLFSPWFTASTTGYYSLAEGDEDQLIRLESWVDIDSTEHAWRLRLGDTFSAGPTWVRSFRFGGVQWMRDFSLRPDIVTIPLPELSEGIAVPSSVDLFINGVQRFSDAAAPGSMRMTDLPVVAGVNTISVVVTDQSGRRTQLVLPLYSSNLMLAKGMSSFVVESGVARRNYSVESANYEGQFAAAGIRYGVSDALTATGYAAAAGDYWTVAGGATFPVGDLFLVDAAAMFSEAGGQPGWAWYVGLERISPRFSIGGRYLESHDYRDLAEVFGYQRIRRQGTASFGVNMGRFGQLNATYAMQELADGDKSSVATGTWGFDLFQRQVNVSTTAYTELETDDWGVLVSVSFPIGRRSQAYVQQSWRDDSESTSAQIRGEAFNQRLIWQVEGSTGDAEYTDGSIDWEGRHANLHFGAAHTEGSTGYRIGIAQTFVTMNNDVFIAGRIDDGFTVVDVEDSPGVLVSLENRTIGRTNRHGRLFVPGLVSYASNEVSIDPLGLPLDASIRDTATLVAPRERAGLVTRFPVIRARSAIVMLRLPDGSPPPVGAQVRIAGVEDVAVAGFDGEIFVRGLSPGANRLDLTWRGGQCTAAFDADVAEGGLPRLGPFTCAP